VSAATAGASLDRDLSRTRRAVESALKRLLAEQGTPPRLLAAMRHSLLAGGKRLRPVLLLWAHEAAGGRDDSDAALRAACAVEMIHTYSLIHDDLPAMDDDALRRGRPTCHVAFDEATAILAGDGLLTRAFGLLATLPAHGAALAAELAAAAGPAGMVGGQQRDLEAEELEPSAALIRRIHRDKTARLIAAPLAMGAALAGAGEASVASLREAGLKLGLAFQAADDLLDATGQTARLGKAAGKDAAAGKATWVALEGEAKARARAERYGRDGARLLHAALPASPARERLTSLAERLWRRDR